MGDEDGRVVVHRLDDGGYKDRGTYMCTACGYRMEGKHRDTAWKHVSVNHDGRGVKLVRLITRVKRTAEEKQMQARERDSRRAARKRVCDASGRGLLSR